MSVDSIKQLIVWGNHSPTMYPDYRFASIDGRSAPEVINDQDWYENTFISTVGKRGAAIIEARGLSSAASAASAAIDHIKDWVLGSNGEWTTMGVPSDGSYGIPEGVIYGFPTICANGDYQIIQDLEINDFSRSKMNNTLQELEEERSAVSHLLS
jgi:malate dehydrogenase